MFKKFLLLVVFLSYASASAFAFSFVVYGDNQGNNPMLERIIKKINQEKGLSFVMVVGDFVPDGGEASYIAYLKKIKQVNVPVYHVMGNHDAMRGGWKIFEKYLGRPYYYFDYENCRFIVINNSFKEFFDKTQFDWLKKTLATAKTERKFVFMHKPTFDPSEIYPDHIMSGRAVIEELMGLFSKYGVDYVFAGHIHGYAKSKRNNVNYMVTAGGGGHLYLPPEFGGFYHYVRIDVDGDKISEQIRMLYE